MSLAPLPKPACCIASSSHFHVVGKSVSETVLGTNLRLDGTPEHRRTQIAVCLKTRTKLAMKLKSFITLPSPPVRSTDLAKFAFKPITEEFVHGQLKQLRTNKAIGLDNISTRLLKDSASVISKSLTKLFNQSLVTCTFPSLWTFGKVSTLYKKGDRCDPNNYRPITVLPTLSKILEKAVHNQLYFFLNDNKSLLPNNLVFDLSYQLIQPWHTLQIMYF